MNDLIEFLEMVALKDSKEVQNILGASLQNFDSLAEIVSQGSAHLDLALEAAIKSGIINLLT